MRELENAGALPSSATGLAGVSGKDCGGVEALVCGSDSLDFGDARLRLHLEIFGLEYSNENLERFGVSSSAREAGRTLGLARLGLNRSRIA